MASCRDCDNNGEWHSPFDGEALCPECARREIIGILADCDPDEIKILRRRTEDALRKNPNMFMEILISMIMKNAIKWIDCV